MDAPSATTYDQQCSAEATAFMAIQPLNNIPYVLDYLDNGNNKMAIQQAEKLLKKHKDLHCAKVRAKKQK